MGMFKNIGDRVRGAANWLKEKFMPEGTPTSQPVPLADTSRYLHVSVPLEPIDNPVLQDILGARYAAQWPGQTRNVGNNQMKRVADSLGANNKERRKIRSRMKRRAAELRAGAALHPGVPALLS